jgi:hypothetical protein
VGLPHTNMTGFVIGLLHNIKVISV